MGNCQPILLSQEGTFPLDDDDFSVAATQSSLFACEGPDFAAKFASSAANNRPKSTSPTKTATRIGPKSNSKTIHKSFLKLHRPDVAERCMIEPDEVNRILWIQADELLRRRGLVQLLALRDNHDPTAVMLKTLQSTLSDKAAFGGTKGNHDNLGEKKGNKFELFSETGGTSMGSGFTTASRSTITAGNNRSQRIFGKENELNHRGTRRQRRASLPGRSRLAAEGAEREAPVNEFLQNRVATIQTPSSSFGRLVPPTQSDVEARRRQYMSVLRLKMKARVGNFFVQRYLPMFPNGPRPRGLQRVRKQNNVPELVSDSFSNSSDSSSRSKNSQSIDFGALPPSTSVKCSVTSEPFLDLAITGSLGLVPRNGGHSKPSSSCESSRGFLIHSKLKSPDHYVVLINRRSGIPLAVCAMKAGAGPPIVRIYATRPRIYGQRPAATTKHLGLEWAKDLPLFAWSEVVSEGEFSNKMKFSMFMANGSQGRFSTQPSYEATLDGTFDHPLIQIVGRTEMERSSTGCALISIRADEHVDSNNRNDPEVHFHMDLAQGIDPALMICFAAIADEVIEKSMRTQCKEHAQRRIRQASHMLAKKRVGKSIHKK
ncbi:hypothetical protein IV203_027526 [Nitzschia inconspicua]|uniref:Tubby C-terminal domain-containing protein n=1 Tax=Nitzschia inconspicua TaxID=303405 RepID=A0A9K3LXV8_9STRA|nr:hypothetical protein IV203_027526 [Nitzschia inconspicua]